MNRTDYCSWAEGEVEIDCCDEHTVRVGQTLRVDFVKLLSFSRLIEQGFDRPGYGQVMRYR